MSYMRFPNTRLLTQSIYFRVNGLDFSVDHIEGKAQIRESFEERKHRDANGTGCYSRSVRSICALFIGLALLCRVLGVIR